MREKMANERILVVDDEESICRLCNLELQKSGLSVDWTTSPLKALDKLRQTHYDLLLTDIKMPQMSGIELMKQVHQLDPGIPVVIMTAYASYEITLQALQQGAANFINKPFHRDEFRFTLQSVLEKQRLAQENLRLKSLINLIRVSEQINVIHEPTRIYSLLLDAAIRETGASRGQIYHFDENSHRLVLEYKGEAGASDGDAEETITENSAQEKAIAGNQGDEKAATEQPPEAVAIPLQTHNKFMGLLSLFRDPGKEFSRTDLDITKILTTQAAIALKNNELLEERERLFLETIKSLASTLDEKDPYTHGHSQRVANIAIEIGKRLQLAPEQLEILGLAGSLHDIGKIGIPDYILQKSTRLTDEEFKIIKTHPEKGAKILSHIRRLQPVVDAVFSHHEWFNGKGYPRGLKGEQIPLSGAIVSLADALDTITTDRPYQKRRTPEEAYRIIRQASGIQFHPKVVSAVLESPLTSLRAFQPSKA